MDGRKMLVLLLMLTRCIGDEVTVVHLEKTPGPEPHVMPICSNSTQNIITLIICKISMSRGKDCRMMYRIEQGFEHKCDSNIRLVMENQTMFLDITGLTSEDSGNYSCECSHLAGTKILHLNITMRVVGGEATCIFKEKPFILIVTGVIIIIIITGVMVGYICRKIHHRNRRQHDRPPSPPVTEHVEEIEPYSTFMQRENVLYSFVKMPSHDTNPPRLTQI